MRKSNFEAKVAFVSSSLIKFVNFQPIKDLDLLFMKQTVIGRRLTASMTMIVNILGHSRKILFTKIEFLILRYCNWIDEALVDQGLFSTRWRI